MYSQKLLPYLLLSTFAHATVGFFGSQYYYSTPSEEQVIIVDIIHDGALASSSTSAPAVEAKPVDPPKIEEAKPIKPRTALKTHDKGEIQQKQDDRGERARLNLAHAVNSPVDSSASATQNTNVGSGSLDVKVHATYAQLILHRFEERKRYPRLARRTHTEGVATIEIVISRDGSLLSKKLVQTSGHEVLDEEVLELADRAAPYPALPSDIGSSTVRFEIPVAFKLV